ncbi:ATP-binding protein [Dysosmobacter sp.]|uniref:ATP-binding protein n=1 Tax=Dysosmobacter sp. TaxID=2591382 RepID=UPI003AB424F6
MRKIVIDPRVIKHLGRDLITSPEVAIIELIKNSIDAKASHINLRLYNSMPSNELIPDCVSDSVPNKYLASPILVVEDDGCGMTDATIDGGFLKIATDIKSNEKSTLGEKGIGRLAAQRLGTALLVETSSDKENHTSYVFIDWNAVINGVVDIPSCDGPNTLHHTRLFIFNTNLEDYIDNATQFRQVSLDTTAFQVQVNRELKSALNFLITPFADAQDTPFIPQIKFYFDEHEVDITFPYDTLALAESIHNFRFEPTEDGMLNYGLNIKPWFIERVHRALVKAEAFKRLKKPHSFYRDILERNSTRIENTLKATATKDELVSLFYNILCDFYAVAEDEDKKLIFDSFIEKKALSAIEELLKIAPITGSIYSFKQGAEAFDYTVNDYFLPVTAGDIFTNSKDEWFVLIGQDCDMARSITRTPKNALAELLPAKVRPQTDFEKWTNDLRTASIYSFRKSLDAGCDVLQVEYQKREYIANEILNLCSFNSTGECKISLSNSIGQEQLMLMPDYMVEYYSKLQQFFLATKTLRIQAEDAFEIVLSKEHSPRLLSFKDFDKTSDTVSFDLKRVCRLTHDYVFYLYKLYLEYRGRQPFQTINLIRQEDTSLPVMYNKEKTGQYLSFRSIPIPDKSNRKNWCWVIDAAELNRVLMLLRLPTLRDGNDDIVLKNECVIRKRQMK